MSQDETQPQPSWLEHKNPSAKKEAETDDRKTTWLPVVPDKPLMDDRMTSFVPPGAAIVNDDRGTTFVQAPPAIGDDRATIFVPPGRPKIDDRGTVFVGGETSAAAVPAVQRPDRPPPSAQPTPRRFAPGEYILHGKYQLRNELAGGNQAMAFAGARVIDDTKVFIKIQRNLTPNRPDTFAKQLEVRDKLLSIDHKNLLRCYELDVEDDALCEVYEFLDGVQLTDLLPPKNSGQFNDKRIFQLIRQLVDAVNALHVATGLAHRDIKPDNIRVVNRDGQETFVIVDYGLVSQLDSVGVTRVGGTRMYAPPDFDMRFTQHENLRSWDWWGVGRIAQEVIDGKHPYDRLPVLFTSDINSGKYGQASSAVQAIFDDIMSERNRDKWRMCAGMVELSEQNAAAAPWVPLLRGLLTSNRSKRWSYLEVSRFLGGEKVQDFYGAKTDVEGFDFEGQSWGLPELALKLAKDSADAGPQGSLAWKKSRDLLFNGPWLIYIKKTIFDEDSFKFLDRCRGLGDEDLAVALALSRLSGGTLPVAIRGVAVNSNFLFDQASRSEDGAIKRLSTLCSADFLSLMAIVSPDAHGQLSADVKRIADLRARFQELKVQGTVPLKQFVALLAVPDGDLEMNIVKNYRKTFNNSSVEQIQALYGQKQISSLSKVDLRVLFLALQFPNDNKFVTHESYAQKLKVAGEKIRDALFSAEVARFASRLFLPLLGSFRLLWIMSIVAFVVLLSVGMSIYAQGFPAFPGTVARYPVAAMYALVWASVYALIGFLNRKQISRKFAKHFNLDPKRTYSQDQLKQFAQKIGGKVDYNKRLTEIQQEIDTIPLNNPAEFKIARVSLATIYLPIGLQVAMLAYAAFGFFAYGPSLVQQRVVAPSPVSNQQQQVPAKPGRSRRQKR